MSLNIPKEPLPLDPRTSLTVGKRGIMMGPDGRKFGGRDHNVLVDETKARYDNIVTGTFSALRQDDGSFKVLL